MKKTYEKPEVEELNVSETNDIISWEDGPVAGGSGNKPIV